MVDNASTEESYGALTRALPEATVLRSMENQGFAKACNQGAFYAIGQCHPSHILFTNNDIHFKDERVADVLIERMATYPEAGIMGPQVLGPDGKRQSPNPPKSFAQQYLLPSWGKLFYKPETLQKLLEKDYREKAEEGPCGWVSGSCFLVDAQVFERVGGFDPATFLYGEELILTARLARAGKSAFFCPDVTVLHDQGAITSQYYDEKAIRKMYFRSHAYYYRQYEGTPSWQILLGRITMWLNMLRGK